MTHNIKQHLYKIGLLVLFGLMFFFPNEIFHGSSQGLLLWFQIVLPTLLPFLIISNLLIYTNTVSLIDRILSPVLCHVFQITKEACFAVLVGFLCGYPMGAKVTADLILTQRISVKEGSYILSFCNNTSPFFIISFIINQNLHMNSSVTPFLTILIISPIIASFLFRLFYRDRNKTSSISMKKKNRKIQVPNMKFGFHILDTCIMNSFAVITKVGGYIILFSIIIACLKSLPFAHCSWFISLLATMEITNGIVLLCETFGHSPVGIIAALMLTSFGGFCAIFQIKSMVSQVELPMKPYILQKVVTSILTGVLSGIYIMI